MLERRPLEASDLYKLRLISDARISPEGTHVAFVLQQMDEKKNEYASNIYIVNMQGDVRQFTSGNKDSAPRWSPNGEFLAFLSKRGDAAQVHVLRADGGESIALTDLKHGAGVPVWSPDGTAIAFAGLISTEPEEQTTDKDDEKIAATNIVDRASYKVDGVGYIGNRRRHIFVVTIADHALRQLTDGDFFDDDPAWSPDGTLIAFGSSRGERWDVTPAGDIYLIPSSGGEARQITRDGAFGRPAFDVSGSRVFFPGNQDMDDVFAPSRLYSASLDEFDLRDELGEWDGSFGAEVLSDVVRPSDDYGQHVSPAVEGAYFLGTVKGTVNIYLATNGLVQSVTRGARTISDFSLNREGGAMAFVGADSVHLSEIYIRNGDQERRLTHENDALLRTVETIGPECFWFEGANGERSQGWLLQPPGPDQNQRALIVYVHGGPHLAHGESFFFEYQLLAGRGFAVFYPNVHGSSSYGRAYQTSIHGDWGNLDFQDVVAGASAAASRPGIDGGRIAIAGGSYGGYMSIWAMAHSDLFRVGVTERCVSNLLSFFGTSDSGWVWDRSFKTTPEKDGYKLWDMSPVKYAANIRAPLLVIQYEGDDRTPLEQGEQIFVALRRLGKETRFIVYPEESHGLTRMGKPSRRVERMEHILAWFDKWL
ncbi:MAG: S9 family peptidase [Chloroflexota bacterium]|nr:MAG: hypothetical protein DLM70_19470 [Chloroflexota bacterium]